MLFFFVSDATDSQHRRGKIMAGHGVLGRTIPREVGQKVFGQVVDSVKGKEIHAAFIPFSFS